MAWRTVQHAGQTWNVSLAAERTPNSSQWNLVFSFRSTEPGKRSIWATHPLTSSSKAALFAQADRISDKDLLALLVTQLA